MENLLVLRRKRRVRGEGRGEMRRIDRQEIDERAIEWRTQIIIYENE